MKAALIATSVAVACVTSCASAEEILFKNGSQYLGLKHTDTTFVACDKTEIPIGDGTIRSTDRLCPRTVIMHPVSAKTDQQKNPTEVQSSSTFQRITRKTRQE